MPELKCNCGHWIYEPPNREGVIICPRCGRRYVPLGMGYYEEGADWTPKAKDWDLEHLLPKFR
jgi:hypothetical protein